MIGDVLDDYDSSLSHGVASRIVLRLYLVRHGETEANLKELVAGQSQSPLTDLGIRQAKALGDCFQNIKLHKLYVSDMERAVQSANHMALSQSKLTIDQRIREIAKGAREGLPKVLTYEEAMIVRQADHPLGYSDLPLLESGDDVWKRVSEWMIDVIREATTETREIHNIDANRFYSVLVVTHSGIIRTLCSKLVSNQLPNSIVSGAIGKDGSSQEHLKVPNSSVTILDISLKDETVDLDDILDLSDFIETKLRLLTWHGHCHDL